MLHTEVLNLVSVLRCAHLRPRLAEWFLCPLLAAVLGELALDGTVRPVRGALPIAARLAENGGLEALLVPTANA